MIQELDEDGTCVTSKDTKNEQPSEPCSISKSPTKRSFLDVNDMDTPSTNAATSKYKNFLLKPLETKRLKPSEALSKVRNFLPFLKESTDKLMTEYKLNPDLVNMESNVDEEDQHIEMNLAYVPESDSDSEDSDESNDNSEESSDDSDGGEEEAEGVDALKEIGLGFTVSDPSKKKLRLTAKVKRKNKPVIQVIEDGSSVLEKEEPTTSNGNGTEKDEE